MYDYALFFLSSFSSIKKSYNSVMILWYSSWDKTCFWCWFISGTKFWPVYNTFLSNVWCLIFPIAWEFIWNL